MEVKQSSRRPENVARNSVHKFILIVRTEYCLRENLLREFFIPRYIRRYCNFTDFKIITPSWPSPTGEGKTPPLLVPEAPLRGRRGLGWGLRLILTIKIFRKSWLLAKPPTRGSLVASFCLSRCFLSGCLRRWRSHAMPSHSDKRNDTLCKGFGEHNENSFLIHEGLFQRLTKYLPLEF